MCNICVIWGISGLYGNIDEALTGQPILMEKDYNLVLSETSPKQKLWGLLWFEVIFWSIPSTDIYGHINLFYIRDFQSEFHK